MPLYDYRCQTCGAIEEHFAPSGLKELPCGECGENAIRVYLTLAKPHWLALAQGDSASPEAIDKFDRMHKQQAAKEKRSFERNGDYGPRPGSDGGSRPYSD